MEKTNYLLQQNFKPLILENLKLVYSFVNKKISFAQNGYDYDDKVQEGMLALVKAALSYTGIAEFSTYASNCIINQLNSYFVRNKKYRFLWSLDYVLGTNEHGEEVTLGDLVPSKELDIADYVDSQNSLKRCFSIILNKLAYKSSLVLLYKMMGVTQKKIGEMYGGTQTNIAILQRDALARMKKFMNKKNIFEERYKVELNLDECKIEFSVDDIENVDKLISKMLETSFNSPSFVIFRSNNKVTLNIYGIEKAMYAIAILIEGIKEYEIDVK